MKSIDEAIKEKRAALLRLQGELETLERALVLLHGGTTPDVQITERLALAGRLSGVPIQKGGRGRNHPMRGKVNPKSAVGLAVAVLREQSVPLHLTQIIAGIRKRGGEPKKTSVASSLAKMSKHGQVFYRADRPNTFGLLEWKAGLAVKVAN